MTFLGVWAEAAEMWLGRKWRTARGQRALFGPDSVMQRCGECSAGAAVAPLDCLLPLVCWNLTPPPPSPPPFPSTPRWPAGSHMRYTHVHHIADVADCLSYM